MADQSALADALLRAEVLRTGMDLELFYNRQTHKWEVRKFEGGKGRPPFAVADTLAEIEKIGIPMAHVFGALFNPPGRQCELYWRRKGSGEIYKRNTYPRRLDPPKTKG